MADEANLDEYVEVPDETLDDLFSNDESERTDDKPDEPEPEKPEAEKPEEPEKKGPPSDPDKHVPLAGLLDERDKRKRAEARIAELEAQLKPEKPQKFTSPFEDEDSFQTQLRDSIKSSADNAELRAVMRLSRAQMVRAHEDFPEREQQFLELASNDNTLIKRMLAADDPAYFAYDYAIKAEKLKKLENVDEFEKELEVKLRAKWEAEREAEDADKAATAARKRAGATPSLANQRSAKGGAGDDPTKEDSLDDLYG